MHITPTPTVFPPIIAGDNYPFLAPKAKEVVISRIFKGAIKRRLYLKGFLKLIMSFVRPVQNHMFRFSAVLF